VTPPVAALRRLAPAPADRLRLALYALYTAVLFVVFLLATFPWELAVRRALAGAAHGPVAVEIDGVRLGWTLAATVDELRLVPRGDGSGPPLVLARAVRAAPSWLGLLRAHPYPLAVRADLYGGALAGTLDLRPAALALDAGLEGVDLARWSGLARLAEGAARGRVSGRIALSGDPARPTTLNGGFELRAADLALEGAKVRGIAVPDLHFAELRIVASVTSGRVDLTELAADGRELVVRGEGNLLLRGPLPASLMSLTLTLAPAAGAPDGLRLALNLLPGTTGSDGGRTLRLSGALGQPRVQ
jgi:type II secretion system protein N